MTIVTFGTPGKPNCFWVFTIRYLRSSAKHLNQVRLNKWWKNEERRPDRFVENISVQIGAEEAGDGCCCLAVIGGGGCSCGNWAHYCIVLSRSTSPRQSRTHGYATHRRSHHTHLSIKSQFTNETDFQIKTEQNNP